MNGFALDENGDVLIRNNEIQMAVGRDLTRQKVQNVLSTNQGEWFLDRTEGIDFRKLLGKNVTEERVRQELESGLQQVDDGFSITDFDYDADTSGRVLTASFRAKTGDGEEIEIDRVWS